jgi:hypothetical protein
MADFPDDRWSGRRVNISREREIPVVPLLTVENVMRMLVCSRSSAYEHMNRALCRTDRPGSLLRVRLDVFESYIAHTLKLAPAPTPPSRASVGASASTATLGPRSSTGAPAIHVAKPPRSRR